MNKNLNCDVHTNYPVTHIDLLKSSSKKLKCGKCFSDQKQQMNFIFLPDLINYTDNSFFKQWPPLSDQQLRKKIIKLKNESQDFNQIITEYYDLLIKEIVELLSKKKKEQLIEVQKIYELREIILQQYFEFASLSKIHECIIQENKQIEQIQEDLKKQIDSQFRSSEDYTIILSNMMKQYELISSLKHKKCIKMKQNILEILETINLIPYNNVDLSNKKDMISIDKILDQEEIIQTEQIIHQNNLLIQSLINDVNQNINDVNTQKLGFLIENLNIYNNQEQNSDNLNATLQFRVCIQDQLVSYGGYPNFSNIQNLNDKQNILVNGIIDMITLQASKSVETIKQELINNSQSSSISIQVEHIRSLSQQYLDLLEDHLKNQQNYSDVSIRIINNTLIGNEGYKMLAQCLRAVQNVQILKLLFEESCQVGSEGLRFLSQEIQNLRQLSDLTILIDGYNYIENEGLICLSNSFLQLKNLVKLQITIGQCNSYDDSGIIVACQSFQQIKLLKYLKFHINGNKISKVGIEAIANSFVQLRNLESLDFSINSKLGQIEGTKELVASLGQLVNLKHLQFSIMQENIISSEISIDLSKSLKNLIKLERFSVNGFKYFQDDQTIACFAEIFDFTPQLKHLELKIDSSKANGKQGAICLSKSLRNLTSLIDFQLIVCSDCNIQEEGCQALALAIKNMNNLIKLVICIEQNNKIGLEGSISLGDALGELKQLESLQLNIKNFNKVNSEGAIAIAAGIGQISNLINLDVSIGRGNYIKQIGMFSFGQALSHLNNLQVLKYSFCENITNLGASGFAQGFQSLRQLKRLQLSFNIDNVKEENLEQFVNNFKYLQNLNSFELSLNNQPNKFNYKDFIKIKHLSTILSILTNLIELQLNISFEEENNYNIINFGKALGSLTNIVKLDLKISDVKIFALKNFTYFESIVHGIKNLVKIQDLKLEFLRITINSDLSKLFGQIFENLVELKKLTLSISINENGIIEQIGKSLQNLQNLNYLYLIFDFNYECRIIDGYEVMILKESLNRLVNLDDIYIKFNQATTKNASMNQIIQENESFQNQDQFNNLGCSFIDILSCINFFESAKRIYFDYNLIDQPSNTIKDQEIKIENQIKQKNQHQTQQQETNNLSLTSLKMQLSKSDDKESEKLNEFLRKIQKYKNIQTLELNIKKNISFTSQQFHLMSNSLTHFQKLQDLTLVFVQNNELGTDSIQCLGNALQKLNMLEQLYLQIGDFNHINEEGADYLAQGIKSLINLKKLRFLLGDCNIQRQAAVQIGDSLQYLVNLTSLYLEIGKGKIESEGAMSIGRAIKRLSNLTTLIIFIGESNQIKKEGACALGESMQHLTNLNKLGLNIDESNSIESGGLEAFFKAVSNMKYLQCLKLYFGDKNQVQSSSISEISQKIKNLDYLKQFDITINLSEITQNYEFDIVDLIKQIDPLNAYFNYEILQNKITSRILNSSDDLFFFEKSYFKIIADISDQQKLPQNIFLPILQINQIPSIKKLAIMTPLNYNFSLEECSALGDTLKHLEYIESLKVSFRENQIGSGISYFGNGLSQLTNLKHLNLVLHKQNDISVQHIIQIGNILSSLINLESFQLLIHYQNYLNLRDLVHLVNPISNFCVKQQCEQDQLFMINDQNQVKCVSVCPSGLVKSNQSLKCQIADQCSLEYLQASQISNNIIALDAYYQQEGLILVFYSNFINVLNAENGSFIRQIQFDKNIILVKHINQQIYLLSQQNQVFAWDSIYQQNVLCSIIQNGIITTFSDILVVINNQSRSFISSFLSQQKKIILTEIDSNLVFNQIEILYENVASILNSYIIQINSNQQILVSYLFQNSQGEISQLQFNSEYTCFINDNSLIQIEELEINGEKAIALLFQNQQAIYIVKQDSASCVEIKPSQQILIKILYLPSCGKQAVDCLQNEWMYALGQNNTLFLVDIVLQEMIASWQLPFQIKDFLIIQQDTQTLIYFLTSQQILTYLIKSSNLTSFNLVDQYQIYINSPSQLIQLIDSNGINNLVVLSDLVQIVKLPLSQIQFFSEFNELEYYNSQQITQIAISDDKLFLAACDISGKIVIWQSSILYQPKFLYQFQSINEEQCQNLLIFQSSFIIAKFQNYIILQSIFNQFKVNQIKIDDESFSKVLVTQNYIYLIYNLKIEIYADYQTLVIEQTLDVDLQEAQVSSYNNLFIVDDNNMIQSYLLNTQLLQISKTDDTYQMLFSLDKMFLFNYPNQGALIFVNDKHNQISILNNTLGVIQRNSNQQGIVQFVSMPEINYFFLLFQDPTQTFGFSCWADQLQIYPNQVVQTFVVKLNKLLDLIFVFKYVDQYNLTHYQATGILPQSISENGSSIFTKETNQIRYSQQKHIQGGLAVKQIQDEQHTVSCVGTVNGYFQCIPLNLIGPANKVYQQYSNQFNSEEIQFVKMSFNYGVYYVIQKTKIQIFDLFTNEYRKQIQFEIEKQISNEEEIILEFLIFETLGIFLSYSSQQIIVQDIANENLYSITKIQVDNSIVKIQGCFLDENLLKIFIYGSTLVQANLDLSGLKIISPQNHYNFITCLFLEKVVICSLKNNLISIYDKFNSFRTIKLFQIQQTQLGDFQIFVDEQNKQIFAYQQGVVAYNFNGIFLTTFGQKANIFELSICSSYLIAYTSQTILKIVAYIVSRQQLVVQQTIILTSENFIRGFCFSAMNVIAYQTNSILTGQFKLFNLVTLQSQGVFSSPYAKNGLGSVINLVYDNDYDMLFFLDSFGNCQLIQFGQVVIVKNLLPNEEIANQVNDPPIAGLLDFNMNEIFVYNRNNIWRFSYNILTQNYFRAYENEFQYHILVNTKTEQSVNSILICDKNNNLFLYDEFQMQFIQRFKDNIVDMKQFKQSNKNIYLIIFPSYLNVMVQNTNIVFNEFKTTYTLSDIQYKKFLLVSGNISIFETQDNHLIDYDFVERRALYTYQFQQDTLVISSFNFQYISSNNQQQNILLLSLSSGCILQYDITIKQCKIIQPYQTNNFVHQFIQQDNSTLVLIMMLGNIIQIDINTMKEQENQMFQQNAQNIKQNVNYNKSSDILLFQFDKINQRYFISISYEKKIGVFNLLTNKFIKFLSFPDQFIKKIYFYDEYLILGSSFQLNFYNSTNLQFLQRYRKSNYQFQMQQFLQISSGVYIACYQIGIEIIVFSGQNEIQQAHFKALTFPNIISINFINQDNNYQILATTKNGIYEYRLSQDYLNTLFLRRSSQNQVVNQQCYFNIPFQNSFLTQNEFDYLFMANTQNMMNFTFSIEVENELQFGNILQSNQQQTDIIFTPNPLNSNILNINQNSFKYINIDVNLINFQLKFSEQEEQQIVFSQNTLNINFQSIQLNNQNISFGNQIFFENKNTVQLVDFEINNINFTNPQKQQKQTQNSLSSSRGLLYFKNVEYVLIDEMTIDSINQFSDNFVLIQAETVQTFIIKSLQITNSIISGNIYFLMNIQSFKIETIQIKNCSQYQTDNPSNSFFLIQLFGIQQALINNLISSQNKYIQLLQSVNYLQTDSFIRNLKDDILIIQNVLVDQHKFPFNQQTNDQINIFWLQNTNITLQNIQFIQNDGNILIIQSQYVLINSSYFYKNEGINGACLSLQTSQIININHTNFTQNNALASGGSIYCLDIIQLIIDQFTLFRNNTAQIGGAIRLTISNDQLEQNINNLNQIKAQFKGNIGKIYGNNIGRYPNKFKIRDSKQNILIEGNLFDQDSSDSMFSVTEIRSGSNLYLQILLYDDDGVEIKIQQNKSINSTYHPSLIKELEFYTFQIQDSTEKVEIRQQSIITYLQYNSTTLSFNFDNIVVAAYPNITTNSTNLELQVTPWQTKKVLNIQISFRNCKFGEAFQQISEYIIQCQQCSEGTYSVSQPILNLQDLSQNECKKCPVGVDLCYSDVLIVSKGFWRENSLSDIIIQCNKNNPNICDPQSKQSIAGCVEGYIGPLCETCDIFQKIWKNGYYVNSVGSSLCQKCDHTIFDFLYILLIIIFIVCFLVYQITMFVNACMIESQGYYLRMMKALPINSTCFKETFFITKIFINYLQTASLLYNSDSLFPKFLQYFILCLIKPVQIINLSAQCFYHLLYMSQRENSKLDFIVLTSISYILTPFSFYIFDALSYFVSNFVCRTIGEQSYIQISLEVLCNDSDFYSFRIIYIVPFLTFWIVFPLIFHYKNLVGINQDQYFKEQTMDNKIILQASKSIEVIKQELQNNSQRTSISIQIQHIRQCSKLYLDLLEDHLNNWQHYQDVQITITSNTLIGDEGFQILSQSLKGLKKVQILKLFLGESCQVGSQGLIYLSEAISDLKQLSDLTIILDSYNYVSNEGLISLASIFSQLLHIIKLQLKIGQSNRYNDSGISVVCQNLKLFKQLQQLKFEIDGSKICKVGAQEIAESLEQLTNLENLDFMIEARLGKVEGAKDLAISLGKLVNLKVLKFSIIQENRICSEVSIELCNSLKKLQKLESFLIKGFQTFQDKQTTLCYVQIFEQIPNLINMNLEIDCPQFQGTYTAICLANCLKNLTKLTDFDINLCYDSNISDEGFSALSQAIKNMRNLKKLVISIDGNNIIGDEGAYSLGEALGELKQLESIKLFLGNQNDISSEGARAIAEGIQKMSNLINLDVRINRINKSNSIEITSFGQILSQLSNLEVLEYCFCSSITNLGAQAFAQGIRSLKKLKKLQFNFSFDKNLAQENQIDFFESFKYLTNLTCLNLQFFKFFENSCIDTWNFSQSLPFLENLIELHLDLSIDVIILSNPNFIKFGKTLGYLTKITKLDLNIVINPPQFISYKLFTIFFESIALGIKKLIQIEDLQLKVNSNYFDLQIQSQIFVQMFQNLTNLKKLVLQVFSAQMVMQIADSLQYLQHLEFLHFNYIFNIKSKQLNKELIHLGKGLCYLTNLHEISLNIYISQPQTDNQKLYYPGTDCGAAISPVDQILNSSMNEIFHGIKSIKNLEKIQITIRNSCGVQIDLLDCINSFENVQNIDFSLGDYCQLKTTKQIKNRFMIQDNTIQLTNQQNLNYQSLTQLSIKIYKMKNQQTNKLENFLKSISCYKNINLFSFIIDNDEIFTFQQFQLMCASLSNFSYLRDLTLSFQENNQIGPQSALYLANAFKSFPELELLSLQIANLNNINEEGAYHLAKGIKSLTNLRQFKFQLGGCNIQKEGAIQIGECLQRLTNLRILFLEIGKDKIESEGAISIGNAIRYLIHLTELKIQIGESNQIQKEGACAFANGMQYLSNLKILNLVINDSNNIESFGVSALCEALSKMNYLQILNIDFGDNNLIQSSSIQEISYVIKSLNNIKNFRIIVHVSQFTSNFSNEIVDMIKLIDPISIIFNYEENQNKIHHEILPYKQFFQNKNFKIITNLQGLEYMFKSIFLPIKSINKIPSVKQLQINTNQYENTCKEECYQLADTFNYMQFLEDLRLQFCKNRIGSAEFQCAKNPSLLTNLKHLSLSLNLQQLFLITRQFIQEMGNQLSQLHNLESFLFSVRDQSGFDSNDLLYIIKCISILQKLKFEQKIEELKQSNDLLVQKLKQQEKIIQDLQKKQESITIQPSNSQQLISQEPNLVQQIGFQSQGMKQDVQKMQQPANVQAQKQIRMNNRLNRIYQEITLQQSNQKDVIQLFLLLDSKINKKINQFDTKHRKQINIFKHQYSFYYAHILFLKEGKSQQYYIMLTLQTFIIEGCNVYDSIFSKQLTCIFKIAGNLNSEKISHLQDMSQLSKYFIQYNSEQNNQQIGKNITGNFIFKYSNDWEYNFIKK
ncbi:hypothetical protein ABPG73_022777 [Tetrahymena malaccensis]